MVQEGNNTKTKNSQNTKNEQNYVKTDQGIGSPIIWYFETQKKKTVWETLITTIKIKLQFRHTTLKTVDTGVKMIS